VAKSKLLKLLKAWLCIYNLKNKRYEIWNMVARRKAEEMEDCKFRRRLGK